MLIDTHKNGFTLVELLVVISVIGILATTVILSLNRAREKAKIVKAKTDIQQFIKAVTAAQTETGQTLLSITSNGCSDCPCRGIGDLRNIPSSHACYTEWVSAINNVQRVTGIGGLEKIDRDPWGSPYGLDENEWEGGPTNCTRDVIRGPAGDGIWGSADDLYYEIALSLCNQ